jgi:N-acetyl-gamma-glutamyl-phosphate reductase
MIKAAIYGATGYGGAELLRLLLTHPQVDVRQATSRDPGRRVDDVHAGLRGLTDLKLSESSPKALDAGLDAVFLALPHGDSTHVMDAVIAQCPHARIFDLAQDFRTGHEDGGWVYGAPELFRDQITGAQKVACPGCFATSILMGTAPAVKSDLQLARIIVDAKTGSSGSGAVPKPLTHHPVRSGTIRAYKVFAHQHEREVKASWSRLDPEHQIPALSFVPQSVASVRGIYASCYLLHADPAQTVNMREVYERFYQECQFVHVLDEPPNVIDVRGTNNVHLYVQEEDGLTLVLSAIDNLCRGASGQAVQCMNLAFGLPEDMGLRLPALVP